MFFLFNKNIPNKNYAVNINVSGIDVEIITAEVKSTAQEIYNFYTPTQQITTSCHYPLNVAELFPYWLQKDSANTTSLITLTETYYQWLNCNTQDINEVSFLRLEDLTDLEQMPGDYVKHLANTYLNGLPSEFINSENYTEGIIDESKVRNLIDNVKVNLYARKGTDESFKFVINELFEIDPDRITVSYPKKYVMRLNSGRFDGMSDNLSDMTDSYLNYSVLYDANYLWQDYSYVVNVSGLTAESYQTTVRPLLHPAGTVDFYQTRQDIFNNLQDSIVIGKNEIPIIKNYRGYTLGSSESLAVCYPGFTSAPTYTFPTWDQEIYDKYYIGMTFGMINIEDFLLLSPISGYTYANEIRSVTTCP